MKLCDKEQLVLDSYSRYVDDCRIVLPSIREGWRWVENSFRYSREFEAEDRTSGLTDEQRTAREVTSAMCSLLPFLRFTSEEASMFKCGTLPTLDVRIWKENGTILHSFYEKPTVGNRMLQKTTALPELSIQATLTQEVVRRLINCSESLKVEAKQEILSNCSQSS